MRNQGDPGVEILVEGTPDSVNAFLFELERDPPPLARITSVDASKREPIGETEFVILRSIEDVAASAQSALADGMACAAVAIAAERGIRDVCFSGSVTYNEMIASTIRNAVECVGMRYRTNESVPCGDGGISLARRPAPVPGWRF